VREPEFSAFGLVPGKAYWLENGGNPTRGTFSSALCYLSRRTGYPHVNSSLTEESVMDDIAWLVPGLADGQRPRGSIIGVAIPLSCDLVTSRTARVGRRTARR
jgi:hypothetical protein